MDWGKILRLFIILLLLWIGLTGTLEYQELMTGVIISALIAIFSSKIIFFPEKKEEPGWPLSFVGGVYALGYLPIYILEEIKAHLQVIYIILHPNMPMKPGIVEVHTDLKTDFGLTGLANSITMTPGTLTVDISNNKSSLYVHWISVFTTDKHEIKREINDKFERYLRRIHG